MSTISAPVTIDPGAAAHVAALGLDAAFRRMLEQLPHILPDLEAVEVEIQYDPEGDDDPGIILYAYRNGPRRVDDPSRDHWRDWIIGTFPPEVFRHVSMFPCTRGGDEDGR